MAAADTQQTQRSQGSPVKSSPKAKAKVAAKVAGKAKAKGKAKGWLAKAKAKGKGKGKAKAKARAVAEGETEQTQDTQPKPKAKAKGRAGLMDLNNRNIDEVVDEARARVSECESKIVEVEEEQKELLKEVDEAKKVLQQMSARVDEATNKETIALEKLKAARAAKAAAAAATRAAKEDTIETAKTLKVLELEIQGRQKLAELEDEKKACQEAADKAKLLMADAKQKEKDATQAIKDVFKDFGEQEQAALKDTADPETLKEAAKERKAESKQAEKAVSQEMAELEKMRMAREKDRYQRCREAAGLGKGRGRGRGLKRLMDASPDPEAAGKAAKAVENID